MDEAFFCAHVPPERLDALWAAGWRHFGTCFFRYDRREQGSATYHVLPLRLEPRAFTPSRSQRRVARRNADLTLCVGPAYVNDAALALFERHKARFRENVPQSLFTFVSAEPATRPCLCLALSLYRHDALVGLSYLDVGGQACSSVYQMFDPDEAKRSLGVLMILQAIRMSERLGKRLYYPGYAYHEPSHYDYKKRFRGLYGYDWAGAWTPLPAYASANALPGE